jgi:N-methylhydantoinase A
LVEANRVPQIIGIDVGGTFTDVVVFDGSGVSGHKVPTSPDQSVAVTATLAGLAAGSESLLLHGTTAGTNAILEERGAKVALVTTAGFEDLIEIARQSRPSLYDSFIDRPSPLVERDLRIGFDGDPRSLADFVRGSDAESVAVALVRSYQEPSEEEGLASMLAAEIEVPVSVAAHVSPPFREYERLATTVLDAYLTPEVSGYLERIDTVIPMRSRQVMTSAGGLLPFGSAMARAGALVLSGPAAGVVAASALGEAKGHRSVISLDMGGTSTDVCRVTTDHPAIAGDTNGIGRVNRVPSVPVRTIGAGGGSVAWVDSGGALRVGPMSAGSVPGPAAYGHGGDRPTVTDANVVTGRIPAGLRLGGTIPVDLAAAGRVMERLGESLGLGCGHSAAGVIDVVDAHMERALRAVSVEEGVDPRGSTLIAFGGAGGLHAVGLARRLSIGTVLIPPMSGVFSALGLLLARPRSDLARTVMVAESSDLASIAAAITTGVGELFRSEHGSAALETAVFGELRYVGQSHELQVPMEPDWVRLRDAFEATHRSRFGFDRPDQAVELVNVNARAFGSAPLAWSDLPLVGATRSPDSYVSTVILDDGPVTVTTWRREELPAGFGISGPAIVVDADAVMWIDRDDHMMVHDDGTLEVEIG